GLFSPGNVMRIVAGSASQTAFALKEALRSSQAICPLCYFKAFVPARRSIELYLEIPQGLAGNIGERRTVHLADGMWKRTAGGLEMTLKTDFHLALRLQAFRIHDGRADLID